MRSFTQLWRENTIPFMHRDQLPGVLYPALPVFYTQSAVDRPRLVSVLRFIPECVCYIQSVMLSPHFTPQSVSYTQSAVCSPCFILTGIEIVSPLQLGNGNIF